ncbi:MAG: HD domain-containing phosphohydrolase [bacterium]
MTAIFLLTILGSERILQDVIGYQAFLPTLLATLIIAIVFHPLREQIQLFFNRSFFRERHSREEAVRDFIQTLSSTLDKNKLVNSVVGVLTDKMHIEKVSIMLLNEAQKKYVTTISSGLSNDYHQFTRDSPIIGRLKKEPKELSRLEAERDVGLKADMEEIEAVLCLPLISRERLLGLIGLGEKKSGTAYNWEDMDLLTTLRYEASIALENSLLYEDRLRSYSNTIKTLLAVIEARDAETHNHSKRVASYAGEIAGELGLSEEEAEAIEIGGFLHDIGKIGVADDVLKKPGGLSEEERNLIRQHAAIGDNILASMELSPTTLEAIRHHHGKPDKGGYPDGLGLDSIPLSARILAVADAYDAMTSDRPYRKAMSREKAIIELKRDSGRHFDPQVVEAMISVLNQGRYSFLK